MTLLSYVHGAVDTPLLGQTIGQNFDEASTKYADQLALVSRQQGIRYTYQELRDQVDRVACSLRRLGFRRGDRLALWATNSAEWTVIQYATAKAGIILVTLNPSYRRKELEYSLNKVSCAGLVLISSFKDSDYESMVYDVVPELKDAPLGELRSANVPSLRYVIKLEDDPSTGILNYKDLLVEPTAAELEALQEVGQELQFDDPINIQFTSGTTGSPKGTTLTHHNILNNGYFIGEKIKLSPADRVSIAVPLFHCFGMVIGNLACVTHGAAMVYHGPVFNPTDNLKVIEEEKCTAAYGVPTMFIAMLEHPEFKSFDLSSLRTGVMAGSVCPMEVMRRVVDEMNMREVTICYGMTETSPVSMQSDVDDPLDKRVSTVGRIHPHVEVKIIDELGRIVPRGVSGELCTRGYSVMQGYWGEPELTAEVIDKARWMHTGDLAVMDEDGYCNIVGRIKDLVIRGGENLFPREIEEFLYTHPAIQDVQVVGVPDEVYGEELCAWIMLKENASLSEEEVKEFCAGQISRQKIPRYIRFAEEFPMTASGKIQKFKIREIMIEELEAAKAQANA
ncbi:Long-chain-fatty-acid--CoA ligase [Oligella urethralis]|uniref:AMP-binding protein n=1 Tax=Oligella urethralis TaxID=90245 RepID=UPI000E022614|nr:AMP-binding protein [Oligella urethralis]SUA52296.1 Long-chain-fatty-acid--CoA ligase [Oligella urethralis]SUA56514.1 Long-chain-fatty-acid--CoA ligase [Oligella urethralis]